MIRFSPEYTERSREVLDTALDHVPAYHDWRKFDPGRDRPIDERYAAMPYLHKAKIRDFFPDGLVPEGWDVRAALERGEIGTASTSGSSDISVTNIWNQEWWDASEKASWQLNSHSARLLTGSHHEALLANPLNVGIRSDNTELPMTQRILDRYLYLNEMSDPSRWTDEHMDRMVRELAEWQPALMEANPSLLARLSRYIADKGIDVYQPGLITFTYEYPSRLHLRQISRVFQSPLASAYGSTETGNVFMECEAGKLHQNSEYCRIDFQPFKEEFGGPSLGRILVTTFRNPWYYMLRFDVRDLARIEESGSCPCGRNDGIILSAIEGRCMSATLDTAGRPVSLKKLDDAVTGLDGIEEYRLEQPKPAVCELYLVTRRDDRDRLAREAKDILKTVYGDEAVTTIQFAESLSPEDSGKYALAKRSYDVDIDQFIA